MKLTQLEPNWTGVYGGNRRGTGVRFQCPKCQEDIVHVPIDPPLDGGLPAGKAWNRRGDTFDTLTLTPSIDYHHVRESTGVECTWHGFITDGEVITC